MNSESKYIFFLSSFLVIAIVGLIAIFARHGAVPMHEFLTTCKQTLLAFTDSHTVISYAAIILLIASVTFFLLKGVFTQLKTRWKMEGLKKNHKVIRHTKLHSILEQNQIDKNSVMVIKSNQDIAFTAGIFNTQIVLSSGMIERFSFKSLEAVILHEYYHYTKKHGAYILIGEMISSGLFFLPIIKSIVTRMRINMENCADEFVIMRQKSHTHLRYALTNVQHTEALSFSPSFTSQKAGSYRKQHKLRMQDSLVSLFVLFLMISLYLLPAGHVQASEDAGSCRRPSMSYLVVDSN